MTSLQFHLFDALMQWVIENDLKELNIRFKAEELKKWPELYKRATHGHVTLNLHPSAVMQLTYLPTGKLHFTMTFMGRVHQIVVPFNAIANVYVPTMPNGSYMMDWPQQDNLTDDDLPTEEYGVTLENSKITGAKTSPIGVPNASKPLLNFGHYPGKTSEPTPPAAVKFPAVKKRKPGELVCLATFRKQKKEEIPT
jgi:stringent starvation protein B